MIPPGMWDEFVIPFWNRYYEGGTTGTGRVLHCEALSPAHLPYLGKAGITHYQPSVSQKITLDDMHKHTNIPFDWLLYAYNVTEMDDSEIEARIVEAMHYNPTLIRTQFGAYAVSSGRIDRLQAFIRLAEQYGALV
jgi:hypothetical protein